MINKPESSNGSVAEPARLTRQPVGIAGARDGEAGDGRGRAAQPVGIHRLNAVRHRRPRWRDRGDGDGIGAGDGAVAVGGAAFQGGAVGRRVGGGRVGGAGRGSSREKGEPEAGRGRHCRRRAARAGVWCLLRSNSRDERRRGSRGVEKWRFSSFPGPVNPWLNGAGGCGLWACGRVKHPGVWARAEPRFSSFSGSRRRQTAGKERLFYFYIFRKHFLQKYIFNFIIYSFVPLPPSRGRHPLEGRRAAGTYM